MGVDLALACGAELVLVSVVSGLWIEHAGQPIGPSLVHSGGRDRAASALKEAAGELAGRRGLGHVEPRLEGFELAIPGASRHGSGSRS